VENEMMTFQRRQPKQVPSRTLKVQQPEPVIELPGSHFEGSSRGMARADDRHEERRQTHRPVAAEPGLGLVKQGSSRVPTEQESISSRDHRRFYQAPIDPTDNQSQASRRTAAQELARGKAQYLEHMRPQTSNVVPSELSGYARPNAVARADQARYQQQELQRQAQYRPQTQQTAVINPQGQARRQHDTPASKKPQLASALQPNFVAERSNQIWSDVASQKSQSYAQAPRVEEVPTEDKRAFLNQNQELIRQMQARGEAVLDDRQSEKSFKSFTQMSQHQKYSKTEPNFDFSSDEIARKPGER